MSTILDFSKFAENKRNWRRKFLPESDDYADAAVMGQRMRAITKWKSRFHRWKMRPGAAGILPATGSVDATAYRSNPAKLRVLTAGTAPHGTRLSRLA
ncbi:hypothetical protein MJ575_19055 [Klebsiella pneumoniae]|nr:hypothetical protein MJ575_19055 [Klebsiella pneumoniae]